MCRRWCNFVFFILCLFGMSKQELTTSREVSVVLEQTNITRLNARALNNAGYTNLEEIVHLSLMGAPNLRHVAVEDLKKMPNLKSFYITQAPLLHRLDMLPRLPKLSTFIVTTSGLVEVPNLSNVHDMSKNTTKFYFLTVDLEGNHIKRLSSHALRIKADQVSLNLNHIEEVPAYAFRHAQINTLSFRSNAKLRRLDEHAFRDMTFLKILDLSGTVITSLPTAGLQTMEVLKIEKTPSLKYIPSIYSFTALQEAHLTHPFHCCAFAFPERHDPQKHIENEEKARQLKQACELQQNNQQMIARKKRSLQPLRTKLERRNKLNTADVSQDSSDGTASEEPQYSSASYDDSGSDDFDHADDDEAFHDVKELSYGYNCKNFSIRRNVSCTPLPDALNPCEDVMGWSWLRASVWLVVAAAVAGNAAVLIVLLAHHAELTVPRFLMCHLAFSDLCTGVYLLMIAVVDLRSFGEFFNYAYDWQYGVGCKIAGFLSVFSGQLSVFTLTIVTLERWFAITYAIYLERRICLSSAAKIMAAGWSFSLMMAGLPLVGISDYSSTSICLPVESENVGDAVYQGSLFMTTALAWFTIVICYVQIYRSLGVGGEKYGGRGAAAAAERRIAKKMAVLIGVDLLCWAPVAFFGVTALAGVPLVDVSHGKVLLVFFYPLNACANPFLYAILTKQYRRDLLTLIARTGKCNWLVARYKLAATPPPTAHTNQSAPATMPLVDYQRTNSRISGASKENGDAML